MTMRRSGIPSRLRIASATEAEFCRAALKAGWTVQKRGWPDFLLTRNGDLCAVEVKRNGQGPKRDQEIVMAALESKSIKCYIWTPRDGFQRWKCDQADQTAHGKVENERGSQSPDVAGAVSLGPSPASPQGFTPARPAAWPPATRRSEN